MLCVVFQILLIFYFNKFTISGCLDLRFKVFIIY